jgi:hypothetical protein
MCIEIYAVPAQDGKISPRRLSDISGLFVARSDRPVKSSLHFSKEKGCGCSLLGDDADPTRPTWELAPAVLEGLAVALEALHKEARGFIFQAIWIGDSVETEAQASLKELLRDVRGNRIRNKHVYKIGRAR